MENAIEQYRSDAQESHDEHVIRDESFRVALVNLMDHLSISPVEALVILGFMPEFQPIKLEKSEKSSSWSDDF